MQTKPEFRRSERFGHEYIIKLGEDLRLSPYYAVSQNLNETGMRFKSIFELYLGSHIMIHIDDYSLDRNQISARVVWCKKLENDSTFNFTVGVAFLQVEMNSGVRASLPAAPPRKTPSKKRSGVVIQMERRRPAEFPWLRRTGPGRTRQNPHRTPQHVEVPPNVEATPTRSTRLYASSHSSNPPISNENLKLVPFTGGWQDNC